MKVKMLMLAVAVCAFATLGFGQNFSYTLSCYNINLTDGCAGGAPAPICQDPETCSPIVNPLPDGTVAKVYEMQGAAPAATDPQPPILGNVGDVSYNEFVLNGDGWGLGGGTFYTEQNFMSLNIYPTGVGRTNKFYIRIITDTDSLVSEWKLAAANGLGEWSFDVWQCFPRESCQNTAVALMPATNPMGGPQNPPVWACVDLCPNRMTVVTVAGLYDADRIPHIYATEGCGNCNPIVPGASATGLIGVDGLGRVIQTSMTEVSLHNWTWTGNLGAAVKGKACLMLDFIESVNMGNIDIVPLSNAVKLTWSTMAETNTDRFEVVRDNNTIGRIRAAGNSSTEKVYAYTDESALNGTTYKYELVVVDGNGERTVVKTASVTPSIDAGVVTEYALHQNFPNPFNPTTKIAFDLVDNNIVNLTIYNATGQVVATVLNGTQYNKGRHSVNFDATNLPSGLYFYTVKIGNEFSATKKMLLLK